MSILVEAVALIIGLGMVVFALAEMTVPVMASAWLMPLLVGAGMALIAAALLFADLRAMPRRAASQEAASDAAQDSSLAQPASPGRVAAWLALSGGYVLVTPWTGFEAATIVFLVVALLSFGKVGWRIILPAALGIAFVLPYVFRHVFYSLVP